MNRIALFATLSVSLAMPALGQSIDGHQMANAVPSQLATELQETEDFSLADSSSGVHLLRPHGGRFEKTIRLIKLEMARPHWGWEDDCGHSDLDGDIAPGS